MVIWGESRSGIGGYGSNILIPALTLGSLRRTGTYGWRPIKELNGNGRKLHSSKLEMLVIFSRGQD
jgi:hypothetical protein